MILFVKKKTRRNKIPQILGGRLYKLIEDLADSDETNLEFYMPAIKQIREMIEEVYKSVCVRGQSQRVESPVFSDMQMGFFCNTFSWLAVCNYKLAWKSFYDFARCDRWPHKGYILSAQEIISLEFILHAFEMADKMPQVYAYELLNNNTERI